LLAHYACYLVVPGEDDGALLLVQRDADPRYGTHPDAETWTAYAGTADDGRHGVRTHMERWERWIPFVLSFVLMVLVAGALSLVIERVRDVEDTLEYGYPRTMHLSGVVEHGDAVGRETHFVAVNLHRQPVVIEFPAGSVEQARVLVLPRLFGARGDRVPVVLRLEHAAGDTGIDLVVNVDGEEILYVNETGAFRIATDAERVEWREDRE
jgi:hypothetical protein